jgi:hypothetical protein
VFHRGVTGPFLDVTERDLECRLSGEKQVGYPGYLPILRISRSAGRGRPDLDIEDAGQHLALDFHLYPEAI